MFTGCLPLGYGYGYTFDLVSSLVGIAVPKSSCMPNPLTYR